MSDSSSCEPTSTATMEKKKRVTELGKHDVLMGRGAFATDYEGNLRLRETVLERYSDYANTSRRSDKHHIAKQIVQSVLQRGGRFLQSGSVVGGGNITVTRRSSSAADEPDHAVNLPSESNPWYAVTDQSILCTKVKQLLRDVGKDTREKYKRLHKGSSADGDIPREIHQRSETVASRRMSDIKEDDHAPARNESQSNNKDDGKKKHKVTPVAPESQASSRSVCKKPEAPSRAELIQHLVSMKEPTVTAIPCAAIQATSNSAQEDEDQKLLVYLALVGQFSQSSADEQQRALLQRQRQEQLLQQQQQQQFFSQGAALDAVTRQIMEQAALEQEIQALTEMRQHSFSPYSSNAPTTTASLQYLVQQQQQAQQLAELERFVQLQQQQQQPQMRQSVGTPWQSQSNQRQTAFSTQQQQQQQQRQRNEELILVQAIEQARIAQLLQSLQQP